MSQNKHGHCFFSETSCFIASLNDIKSRNTPKICFAIEALLISNFPIIFQQCMVAQVTNFHGYSPKRKIIMAHTETGPYETFRNLRSDHGLKLGEVILRSPVDWFVVEIYQYFILFLHASV